MSDTAEQAYIEEQAVEPAKKKEFRLATVTALLDDGCAKIKFDEDEEASEKEYAYISSYQPEVDDRVLLASIGSSWVILGNIRYAAAPEGGGGLQINGVTLSGNKSSADLGLASETHTHSYSSITDKPKINNTTIQDGNNTLANLGIAAASHTHSYSSITDKPKINNTTIQDGNNTLANLGIAAASHVHDNISAPNSTNISVGLLGVTSTNVQFAPTGTVNIALGTSSKPWTDAYIAGTTYLAYTSGKLSFFGNSSPKSKTTVSTCSTASSVTASTVATALNNLINALKGYGLV